MKRALLTLLTLLLAACQSGPVPADEPPPSQSQTLGEFPLAPAPTAQDQDGNTVEFGELYRQGTVLVFFYPKAGTPGCTAQACSLRDAYETLTDHGVTVVGVSTDDAESQKAFKAEHSLPYILIPDPEGRVLEAFGVDSTAGFANREAFLIKNGKVHWHDDSASTEKQAEDVLAVIKSWR